MNKDSFFRWLRWGLIFITGVIAAHAFLFSFLKPPTAIKLELALYLILLLATLPFACRWLNRLKPRHSFWIVVGVALLLRMAWMTQVRNEWVSDFAIYHELAQAVESGQGYILTGPAGAEDLQLYLGQDKQLPYRTANRAPGIAFFGALLIHLFGSSIWVLKLFNVLLSVGSVILLFLLLKRSPHPELAPSASLLWALYPPSVMATNLFGTETLFVFFLLLSAFAITHVAKNDWRTTLGLGLLIAWTSLIRSMLVALVLSVLSVFALIKPSKKALFHGVLFLGVVATALSPWIGRNWQIFHRIIPVCTMEGEFLGRHTAYLLYDDQQLEQNPRYQAWRAITDEAERSAAGYRLAMENWQEILSRGVPFVLKTLAFTTQRAFSTDDEILYWSVLGTTLSKEPIKRLRWLTQAVYLFILVGALIGLGRSSTSWLSQSPPLAFLAISFVFFFLTNALVLALARYHFAMMPLLTILAAQGYLGILSRPQEAKC